MNECFSEKSGKVIGHETTLYKSVNKKFKRPGKRKMVILTSSGYGNDYAAKMVFASQTLVRVDVNRVGFYLQDTSEWSLVRELLNQNKEVVVLILSIDWKKWSHILEHEISTTTNNNLSVIITSDSNFEHPRSFDDFIVDAAQTDENGPLEVDKIGVFDHFMKIENVILIEDDNTDFVQMPPENNRTLENRRPKISTKARDIIIDTIGNVQWVHKMKVFFRSYLHEGSYFFRKPIPEIVKELLAMNETYSMKFWVMMDVFVYEGYLDDKRVGILGRLQYNFRRGLSISCQDISLVHTLKETFGRKASPSMTKERMFYEYGRQQNLIEYVGRLGTALHELLGQYVIQVDGLYIFSSVNVRSSFLVALFDLYPEVVIEHCDAKFLFEFVRQSDSIIKGRCASFSTCNIRCLKALLKRLKGHWFNGEVEKCLRHPTLISNFKLFLDHVKKVKHDEWKALRKCDIDDKNHCALYFGVKGGESHRNTTATILNDSKWPLKRTKPHWKAFIDTQEQDALILAAELDNENAFECLIKHGTNMSMPSIQQAVRSQSLKVLTFCIRRAKLNDESWNEILYVALEELSNNSQSKEEKHVYDLILSHPKVDVNFKAVGRKPVIYRAAEQNNESMLMVLLAGTSPKPDVNILYHDENNKPSTPLLCAVKNGFKESVHLLLAHGANQGLEEIRKRPINLAAKKGYLEIVQMLYQENPDIITETDNSGRTPLMEAVLYGKNDVVLYLLALQASAIHDKDEHERTLVHLAVLSANNEVLDLLLKRNPDVRLRDRYGDTPLQLAVKNNLVDACRILINYQKTKGYAFEDIAFVRAVESEKIDILQMMLEQGYNPNAMETEFGPPLSLAVQKGYLDVVKLLVNNNADVNIECNAGFRPIHMACRWNRKEILEYLIDKGADILAVQPNTRDTVVHMAAKHSDTAILEIIFRHKESDKLVDQLNVDRETALHEASRNGFPNVVSFLLSKEFQKAFLNRKGQIPVKCARGQLVGADCHKRCKLLDTVRLLE